MIQLRRDTAANWTSANPVLGAGQPGIETDTQLWKVGDGVTAWASLAYMVAGGGGGVTDGDKGDVVVSGGGAVWSIDYTAVNAVVAPVWGNITSKPAAVTALTGTNTGDQTTIVGITGTKAQFDTAVTDGNVQWVGDAPTAHTHLLTITAANLNAMDDGVNTALHFHDADRARAVHTGTQLAATISDFDTAVAANAAVTANTAKVTNATHTGDVTGATALTIAAGAVSLAKMADIATASLIYRKTAGTGVPETQTIATLKTDLGLTGTNTGDQATDLTYTASTRVIASSTGLDATLPLMSSGDAGLVPASGGGTTNFLRADGTFAAPSGGGGSYQSPLWSQLA
jgi:hypothetical protein